MPGAFLSAALFVTLLNPFMIVIYLVDVIHKVDRDRFRRVLTRAGGIAGAVFCAFALLGDAIFSTVIQAEFASFQIFGGVVFLLIGLQFLFQGPAAIEMLRGDAKELAGAIAMPVLIGPGTVSASVVVGQRHNGFVACAIVLLGVTLCVMTIVLLKAAHDYVRPRNEALIQRYIEVAGRITALYVGTVSIEMIMQGALVWARKF
ncbi:MarC family protein [Alienimonas sp. DA493]|uniref:MarC family protein n=1 Tax=Alienimonas sp. DA493 TaxID=3373605 RepID=UPI0037552039